MPDLTFASWAQSPIGRAIAAGDGLGPPGSAGFRPGLVVRHPDGNTTPVFGPAMRMLGPEGVSGLDPRGVVRCDPPDGASEVEANYLASVEFDCLELPWLFTPAAPDARGRLRPWIVLVVVESERSVLRPSDPTAVLTVGRDQLPDLADSWGWAHIQQPAPDATPPPGLGALVGRSVARLICPRQLAPNRHYRACVVPAFAGGREAGLDLPVTEATVSAPSWKVTDSGDIDLPVYFSWQFATGPAGDFEQLVRRLTPAAPERIVGLGRRLVDISKPWDADLGLSGPQPATLAVPGALVTFDEGPAGTADEDTFTDLAFRLQAHLNAPAERVAGETPDERATAVAPPIYGGRHVSRKRVSVDPPAEPPADPWVEELNLLPPGRIAAGLGAEYVRIHQEQLMARAWEQVGAIREANRRRALGELSATVAESLHRRHVQTLAPGEAVALSSPAAWRIRRAAGSTTLAAEIGVSTLADAAATPAFVRLLRPGGPVARAARTDCRPLIERGLTGEVMPPEVRPLLAGVEGTEIEATGPPGDMAFGAVVAGRSTAVARRLTTLWALSDAALASGLTDAADRLRQRLEAVPVDAGTVASGDLRALRLAIAPMLDVAGSEVTGADGDLFSGGMEEASGPAVTPFGVRVDMGSLHTRIVSALAPGERIVRRVASQVTLPARYGDPLSLAPVMEHPVFPAPMAMALVDMAPDWLLPGIADFPADSATLLMVNAPFVESFLVGLSHEFNRELLWREYPTDQRGTPFRSFWPRADGSTDIPPIHTWTGALGEHLAGSDICVLLVRGAVVQRFPGMTPACVPARSAGPGLPPVPDTDPATWLPPLFTLRVDAATAAYAFAVDPDELRGPPSSQTPGRFFAFQEHSYRIRFGFDLADTQPPDPNRPFHTWNDLDWDRVPRSRGFAVAGRGITPPDSEPGAGAARWDRDSADIARICLQRPFRVLIHSHELVGG